MTDTFAKLLAVHSPAPPSEPTGSSAADDVTPVADEAPPCPNGKAGPCRACDLVAEHAATANAQEASPPRASRFTCS